MEAVKCRNTDRSRWRTGSDGKAGRQSKARARLWREKSFAGNVRSFPCPAPAMMAGHLTAGFLRSLLLVRQRGFFVRSEMFSIIVSDFESNLIAPVGESRHRG